MKRSKLEIALNVLCLIVAVVIAYNVIQPSKPKYIYVYDKASQDSIRILKSIVYLQNIAFKKANTLASVSIDYMQAEAEYVQIKSTTHNLLDDRLSNALYKQSEAKRILYNIINTYTTDISDIMLIVGHKADSVGINSELFY